MMERTPDYVRNRLPEYADMIKNILTAATLSDGTWIALTLSNYSGSDWQPSIAYVRAEGGIPRVVVAGGFNPSWRP